uniref:Unique cartilage matrix-associated protein n=1 Tax=Acanthochromis polyacanthus TaxID=80966 RepID=A0A3Q1FII6_9TELE
HCKQPEISQENLTTILCLSLSFTHYNLQMTVFLQRHKTFTELNNRVSEQRVKIAASERRREYNEEQRNEYENYAEEDRDEINERSRETNEQLREYHYDGLYPRYYWFH